MNEAWREAMYMVNNGANGFLAIRWYYAPTPNARLDDITILEIFDKKTDLVLMYAASNGLLNQGLWNHGAAVDSDLPDFPAVVDSNSVINFKKKH